MDTTTKAPGLTWQDLCEDPHLQNLPYKIELNQWGQILMSPTRLHHGRFQLKIGQLLESFLGAQGRSVTECAIQTAEGTRVANVGWFSEALWAQVQESYASPVAPEICVEILSPTNAPGEMAHKRVLYADAGAAEVWVCDVKGHIHFFVDGIQKPTSTLVPDFPLHITL